MKLITIILSIAILMEGLLGEYSHFDSALLNYVDSGGSVNYQGIIENPYNINQFLDFIEKISPDSHPKYFPTKNDRLAYWINTYNSLIIKLMIDNPDKNILDISWGHLVWFTKFKVGGERTSLYKIEHQILRKMDPRIHFAISCGSTSCPPLGNRIFLGETINSQLDEKTINFINDSKNVYLDYENKVIYLSKIFKWYEKDFGNVRKFVLKYLKEAVDYSLIKNYKIKYNKYDWSSNNSQKKSNN